MQLNTCSAHSRVTRTTCLRGEVQKYRGEQSGRGRPDASIHALSVCARTLDNDLSEKYRRHTLAHRVQAKRELETMERMTCQPAVMTAHVPVALEVPTSMRGAVAEVLN